MAIPVNLAAQAIGNVLGASPPQPAVQPHPWKKVVVGKIPYSIGMKDDLPFVFSGLCEGWEDPATEEWLHTCTMFQLNHGRSDRGQVAFDLPLPEANP